MKPTTYEPHEIQFVEEDGTIYAYDSDVKLFECPFDSRGMQNCALYAFNKGIKRGFEQGVASVQAELRKLLGVTK